MIIFYYDFISDADVELENVNQGIKNKTKKPYEIIG